MAYRTSFHIMLFERGCAVLYGTSVAEAGAISPTLLIAARTIGWTFVGNAFGISIAPQTRSHGDEPSGGDEAWRTHERRAARSAGAGVPDRVARVCLRHEPGPPHADRACDRRCGGPPAAAVEVDGRAARARPAQAW